MKKISISIGVLFTFLVPVLVFAAQAQVSLGVNSISPSTIAVNAGDTVVWTNTSGTTQSVTGNNSLFQSGSIAPGGQFAATFNTSGTYNYYDNANGSAILGEIIVNGSTAANAVTTTAYNPNATYYTSSTSGSTNPTVSSLESEVQALIAQINAMQGNSGGATTNGSSAPTYTAGGSCPQIGRVLSLGVSGSDVSSLQQFLGVSPASGYYGSLTQSAVESWQASNNIISYGTSDTTGYGVVGPRTAAAIRLACSKGQSGSSSTGTSGSSGVVSGFLQVSPIQGSAPLTVTITATVNTAQSCSGGTYTLSYGDGSQNQTINTQSGNCSQQNETFQHTYQSGGTFTITLSAGTHSSTALVTVNGPTTSTTGTTNSTNASGSMSAFVTVGPAPLATTFYVSCASGLAYDVVFGDGTDLGSSGVSQSTCNGGLQSVAHTYTKAGSYNAQLVVFVRNAQGTISSQNVATQGITVTGATTGTGTTASSYPKPALTPDVGNNPLEVSLQFTGGTCSGAYSITWGDTSISPSPSVDNPSGCAPNATQSYSITHTYSAAGNYTVTLTRALPSGSSQSDTVGVAISS